MSRLVFSIAAFAFCGVALIASASLWGQEAALETPASWKQPTLNEAKTRIQGVLADQDEALKAKAELIWTPPQEGGLEADMLERAALTAALLSGEIGDLVETCRSEPENSRSPNPDWSQVPETLAHNARLFFARWLVRNNLFDEAKQHLDAIEVGEVVDPATLLFYQAVVAHRLLDKTTCMEASTKLLENAGEIPRRYEQLARLMSADIKPLKIDSPDEIARLMGDVERRLELGRAGKRVRGQQDDIVEKLDKIIKKIEDQLKQQQSSSSAGGSPSGTPASDSQAGGQTGPGNTDPKEHENRKNWGNLPPEQRRSTLQQISRELGAHYREVIEEYFRKIAQDSD